MVLRAKKDNRIEKPEDKTWQEWYEKLDNKEHEKMLAQLGLEKEDIEEWGHHRVFQDIEEEAQSADSVLVEKKSKKKK